MSHEHWKHVDIRVGTIIKAEEFPQAHQPAYRLLIDFGPVIGQRKSSAQITAAYRAKELAGQQVLAVVNLPARQIGPMMSEVLVLGLADAAGQIRLVAPDQAVPNGQRLH